jgi:anaerobic selenocysteine-containing dehydrogenase
MSSSSATGDTRFHYRTCNLCEAMCGIEIELAGDAIVAIRGDEEDPFSQGHVCPKAVALQDLHADPDRLRRPVRKTAAGWRQIEWVEAFDRVAAGLGGIRERHGADAVGIYLGNPNVHNLGSMLFNSTVRRAIGTRSVFSATSVDQLPHHVAARSMFGHLLVLPIPDVDRTDFFLILGANPVASNGSLMTAPGIARRIRAIRERGGRVVLVDPRRTETAREADRHHFIQPGKDVLLLLALLHTVFDEALTSPGRLEGMTTGIPEVERVVRGFSPERVAETIRWTPEEIRGLARDFAAASSAVCYGRMGLSTQAFGGLCQWAINALNILTGNLDRAGGAMFPTPAVDIVTPHRAGKAGRWHSRVRGLPEFAGELPAATLAEEIATPGEGRIRGLLTIAGNPVLSTPNGGALDRALGGTPDDDSSGLEFMAAIDIYVNETTRHADVILPPTTGLECDHYDLVFHTLAVRNTAKYSPALFAPAESALHDWQIYRELAKRLSPPERPFEAGDPRNMATPAQAIDHGLRTGPHAADGLSLSRLLEEPHGIDLGPLEPRLPDRLFTDDKKIDLAPPEFLADLERAAALLQSPGKANGKLSLIGRRDLRSNNSWMHNSLRLVRGRNRCTLMIHPDDASERGVSNGETVAVESRVGQIELPAEVTDAVMPGVVSIPHGWGHAREGTQLGVAQAHAGASINDLTDELLLDELTGNAALSGVAVRVRATQESNG